MKPELRTGTQPHVQGQAHPTTKTFTNVGILLGIITAIEFGVLYVTGLGTLMVITLAVLSVVKFVLVAAYFMHLRFDGRLLAGIFTVGVLLATAITIAMRFITQA